MTKKEAIQTLHDYRTWCLGKHMPKETEIFEAIDVVTECLGFKSGSDWCKGCNQVFSDDLVDGKCGSCRESSQVIPRFAKP